MARCASPWLNLFWLMAISTPVGAQSALSLDRLEPSSPDSALFSVSDAKLSAGSPLRFGFLGSYAAAPLVLATGPGGSQSEGEVVAHQEVLHTQIAVRLHARWSIDADLPLLRTTKGPAASAPATDELPLPSSGQGSLRLGSKWTLTEQLRWLPATGIAARLWLPAGDATTDDPLRYSLEFLTGADIGAWLWRINVGRRRQWDESILPTTRSGWTSAAGVAYRYRALQLGPELFGSTAASHTSKAFSRRNNHLEALLGIKYQWTAFVFGAAFGPGLARGPGTPSYRALFSVSIDPAYGHVEPKPVARTETGTDVAPSNASLASGQDNTVARTDAATASSPCKSTSPASPCLGARDNDQDGIPNSLDVCPELPGIAHNLAERNGCPADSDQDGIPDALDACPELKGEPSSDPKRNGCKGLISVTGQSLTISQQIQFATGGDVLLPTSVPILAELAQLLGEHPEITRVAVDGHTDNIGEGAANLALSRRRALAVVRWLVAHGVDERRLEARGFGPRQPLESNDSEAGRARNRRVEFIIRKRSAEGSASWQTGAARD